MVGLLSPVTAPVEEEQPSFWGGMLSNPISQGLAGSANILTGVGMGLLSGNNWQEGFANAGQYAAQGAQTDLQNRQRWQKNTLEANQTANAQTYLERNAPDLVPLLATGVSANSLIQMSIDRQEEAKTQAEAEAKRAQEQQQRLQLSQFITDPALKAAWEAGQVDWSTVYTAQNGGGEADWSRLNDGALYNERTGEIIAAGPDVPGAGGGVDVGLQPQWGVDENGNPVLGQMSSDGRFVQTELPPGITPMDPRTLNSERRAGTEYGSTQGSLDAAAPADVVAADTALQLLDQIEEHPELPWATGTSVQFGGNTLAGTGRNAFQQMVDQAKNGAFLTAIQEMRGLGSLSNAEGQTATSAITRMNTTLSETEFMKALDDYRAIIDRGRERAAARLDNAQRYEPGGGSSTGGETRAVNPQTGEVLVLRSGQWVPE